MTPRTPRSFLLSLAALAALSCVRVASAEVYPAETLAFGYLVEHADAVVVATPIDDRSEGDRGVHWITLEVEESIRGPLVRMERVTLLFQDLGAGLPYALRERHLAFLRALPATEGQPRRWALLSGELGIRPVPASGPVARFPGLCRDIAEVLDDAAGYRALLVRGIEDEDPGMAWSAATDLVRHAEMHAALTPDEQTRIVSAFERQPIGKETKKALALAAGATLHPSAAPALVASLLLPRAREIRIEVGEALRRLGSPHAVALLVQALEQAESEQAVNLLNALGTMAPAAAPAAEAARGRVLDPVRAVRIEAAHALGLVVREQHRANPSVRLRGREDLLTALAKAGTGNEQLAVVWALAQFDEPAAYEALETLAASDERPLVRQAAERYLANPRLSLVLE